MRNYNNIFMKELKTLKEETTKIHHEKITKLNRGSVGQNYLCMKSKVVHNFSSCKLSEAEERLLCRGWEFCIENRITNFCELKTDVELNASKLEQYCHPSVFKKVCSRIQNFSEILIKSIKNKKIRNISDEEFSALKSLKNNKNIVICKADKGNSIIILDKTDYITKAQEILTLNQFKPLKNSPLKEKEASMNKYLHKLYKENVIDQKLFWRLHSTSSSIATMYGQPKIHKLNYPLRPIISSVNTYNYELSRYLTEIIKNNRSFRSFSCIRDSFEFVKRIRTLKDSNSHTMVSFDVDNLYTNVPVNEAIEITLDTLYKRENPPPIPFNRAQLKTLLEMSVCHIPFRFLDKVYIQTDGVAMGSPLGPILADLFMSKLEAKLNRFSKNKPILWLRYVDDIFCVFNNSQNIHDFLSRINKWHPSHIRFTIEHEQNNQLAFLDVLVTRDRHSNQYTTTIYRKPTNTNLYLLYESNQCRQYKISLIRTLVIRICLICSSETLKNIELDQMKKTLNENGYPPHLVRRGIREAEVIVKKMSTKTENSQAIDRKTTITFLIPYYGQESTIFAQRLKRTFKKFLPLLQIRIAFRKNLSIKSIFLPIQKGQDLTKKMKKLVYKIPCSNCDKCYIGETNREKSTRMKEHKKDIRNSSESSHVAKHANKEKHSFEFENVEILSLESNWRRRIIKESLFTQETLGKSLNDTKFKLNIFV